MCQAEPSSWPDADDDDDDGTDDDALPHSALPLGHCHWFISLASGSGSPRLLESWQGTAECFKAKKNQLKENKLTHTLTFAHEQTKRFAQFWL